MPTKIPQEEVKRQLTYNPNTGVFTRNTKSIRFPIGIIAGCPNPNGYIGVKINYEKYLAHRLAWVYVYGYWPTNEIDHINGVKDDNRIHNLREATRNQNSYNHKLYKTNTSGVKGITWDRSRNKWLAQLRVNGKKVIVGSFTDLSQAKIAIDGARQKYHKEFAKYF